MQSWFKQNWFKIILALGFLWVFFGDNNSELSGKWQAIYYPDGCLTCEESYIFSPFFKDVNQCIGWVHEKAKTRPGNIDSAECALKPPS
jgi:hypothetical protein